MYCVLHGDFPIHSSCPICGSTVGGAVAYNGFCALHGYWASAAGGCPTCALRESADRQRLVAAFKGAYPQGWECPKCHHIWACWIEECQECKPKKDIEFTDGV